MDGGELRSVRLACLKSLRKGAGLGRLDAPTDLPFAAFSVQDWAELKTLIGHAAVLASNGSAAVEAAQIALGAAHRGYGPSLTERREAAARDLGISVRSVQRLEDEGIAAIEEWVRRLRDPLEITMEFTRMNVILDEAKRALTSPPYSPEHLDSAQHYLMASLQFTGKIGG